MKFDKYLPAIQLRNYIKHYIVSESEVGNKYKVFPSTGLVVGFQYRGRLSAIYYKNERSLASAGITGISGSYSVFKNPGQIGTILVYFTAIGFAHFSSLPANELFNLSISLYEIFDNEALQKLEERMCSAHSDTERLKLVDDFFLSQLQDIQADQLVIEAVNILCKNQGRIKIKMLGEMLCISQSPLEKRFRKVVGTSPKKFASIVRFNRVLDLLNGSESLTSIGYENNFFDQSHFIRDFKQFTGSTPEDYKRFL